MCSICIETCSVIRKDLKNKRSEIKTKETNDGLSEFIPPYVYIVL